MPAEVLSENVFDIRDFGAVPNDENADNASAINAAIDAASSAKGIVLVSGGSFTATTVFFLKAM
ncbi:MAG: glycoside hydrolase family 55 protein [Anaerotruncus sp.]|nr:MAG: glycoside hydrolase family 55 protein [Anaerotruncus sp.]